MPRCEMCMHWLLEYPVGNPDCNQHACGILSYSRGCNVFDAGKKMVYTPPDFGCVYYEPDSEAVRLSTDV